MADHAHEGTPPTPRQFVLGILKEPGVVQQRIQVLPLDHPPTDDDFARPVDAQHVVIDTSTPALWARIGGTWMSATLT
jgi:hypothetical protein